MATLTSAAGWRTVSHLLGARVIATNEHGGRWRGHCRQVTFWGEVVVECDGIDIGYGWHALDEERRFPVEWVKVDEEGRDE